MLRSYKIYYDEKCNIIKVHFSMTASGNETENKTVSCLPVKKLTKKMFSGVMLLVAYLFMIF